MTFELVKKETTSKADLYDHLKAQLRSLFEGETDFIANAANFSSLLYHSLPEINWAGVYILKDGELVLGPFQGKPACVRIEMGKGVCGTAAQLQQTVVVENVHEFPGHIACDSDSNSEIVVPLIKGGELIGVLDVDSPLMGRFDEDDVSGLVQLTTVFVESTSIK